MKGEGRERRLTPRQHSKTWGLAASPGASQGYRQRKMQIQQPTVAFKTRHMVPLRSAVRAWWGNKTTRPHHRVTGTWQPGCLTQKVEAGTVDAEPVTWEGGPAAPACHRMNLCACHSKLGRSQRMKTVLSAGLGLAWAPGGLWLAAPGLWTPVTAGRLVMAGCAATNSMGGSHVDVRGVRHPQTCHQVCKRKRRTGKAGAAHLFGLGRAQVGWELPPSQVCRADLHARAESWLCCPQRVLLEL